jgi:hypothetical protein
MAEIKWDIKIRGEIYRGVSDSRLQRWIFTGKIKPGEALVWRSSFSGWRRPEELKELWPFFKRYEKPQLKKIKRNRAMSRVLPTKKRKDTLVIDNEKNPHRSFSDILSRTFLTKR